MTVLDNNLKTLDGFLARFRDTGILNRIAGQDVAGSKGVFQSTSPVDKSAPDALGRARAGKLVQTRDNICRRRDKGL